MTRRDVFMELILELENDLGFEMEIKSIDNKGFFSPSVEMIKRSDTNPFIEMRIRVDHMFFESAKFTMHINDNHYVSANYSLQSNYPLKLFLEIMVDKYIQSISNDLNKLIMNDKRVKI